jgi:CheY-like chemotaxis protein
MKTESRLFYVEDNPDDVLLTKLALARAGITAKLETAPDGTEAIKALQSMNSGDLPDCILLDVKLPTSSGLEVLAWIRSQPHLKRLPVIMLTSSLLPSDIAQAYDLGANSYLLKPSDLHSLVALAKAIDLYWFQTNVRPNASV